MFSEWQQTDSFAVFVWTLIYGSSLLQNNVNVKHKLSEAPALHGGNKFNVKDRNIRAERTFILWLKHLSRMCYNYEKMCLNYINHIFIVSSVHIKPKVHKVFYNNVLNVVP